MRADQQIQERILPQGAKTAADEAMLREAHAEVATGIPEVQTFEHLLEAYREQAELTEKLYWQTIGARQTAQAHLTVNGLDYSLVYPQRIRR